jgi:ankyrin repeat protein
VDRGHYEVTELLLKSGADPKTEDNDGQTPLDYAVTCEYENITSLLQEKLKLGDSWLV